MICFTFLQLTEADVSGALESEKFQPEEASGKFLPTETSGKFQPDGAAGTFTPSGNFLPAGADQRVEQLDSDESKKHSEPLSTEGEGDQLGVDKEETDAEKNQEDVPGVKVADVGGTEEEEALAGGTRPASEHDPSGGDLESVQEPTKSHGGVLPSDIDGDEGKEAATAEQQVGGTASQTKSIKDVDEDVSETATLDTDQPTDQAGEDAEEKVGEESEEVIENEEFDDSKQLADGQTVDDEGSELADEELTRQPRGAKNRPGEAETDSDGLTGKAKGIDDGSEEGATDATSKEEELEKVKEDAGDVGEDGEGAEGTGELSEAGIKAGKGAGGLNDAKPDDEESEEGLASETNREGTKQTGGPEVQTAELLTEAKPDTELETQAEESTIEKEFEVPVAQQVAQQEEVSEAEEGDTEETEASSTFFKVPSYDWPVCEAEKTDYIPCLDNKKALKQLQSTSHYQHRERHCPKAEEFERCLVPLPQNYKEHINWPKSRDRIWFSNVPHPKLVSYKKDQNWVQKDNDEFVFPGGGTQFKHGASQYIDSVQETVPEIAWGEHVKVALDMGCGVASWGAYLFNYNVTVISMAPKDEHEAQVQFALERGVPALLGVMGTQRLPFSSNSFDVVHCSRCRVPWHIDGGMLLLEINRVLRPGQTHSSPPSLVRRSWVDSSCGLPLRCTAASLRRWRFGKVLPSCSRSLRPVAKKPLGNVGIAVWQKPTDNNCYENRPKADPPMCDQEDNPDAAWYVPMQACLHYLPAKEDARGIMWPAAGAARTFTAPPWLASMGRGMYGRPMPEEFKKDTEHWQRVVARSYARDLGINWPAVRNVMDMNAHYAGFGAALSDRPLWVMNVIPVSAPDTLPIVFERGLIGVYHDWCESFNTYPRTYDLLHVDHLLSQEESRCDIADIFLEMDRILRPKGWVILRDRVELVPKMEELAKALHWETKVSYTERNEGLLAFQKDFWRPAAAAA
eukprot:jgi/Mesen1/3820/ME000207S02830